MVTNHVRLSATAEANSVGLLSGGFARAAALDSTGTLSRGCHNSKHPLAMGTAAPNTSTHWRQWLAELTQMMAGTVGRG
jgi:hypothetical protein